MNQAEKASRSNLARQHHIGFRGPVQPDDWPATHKRLFSDVLELGRQKYGTFVESISVDSIQKPWRSVTKSRADRLSKLADKAWNEDKNEPSWRANVENDVLHRFTVEVACPQCRNLLWGSEIPAATDGIGARAEKLEFRRQKRKPCRCPPMWGQSQFAAPFGLIV
ncbi:hypothetical protein NUU61_003799 [Penicillium alfredii]|uniref:Uncharacterized protein n=1 Tax=Penicillium alfredii TaxID=1506179 RepID=A0A9W9FK06_9EURO|nr:uncharacterized protein NUU61_003799 [Penicillium alfredii]KAJ5101577.1 hypothetical protein NUU61_003799 [Penicillium alfredii]